MRRVLVIVVALSITSTCIAYGFVNGNTYNVVYSFVNKCKQRTVYFSYLNAAGYEAISPIKPQSEEDNIPAFSSEDDFSLGFDLITASLMAYTADHSLELIIATSPVVESGSIDSLTPGIHTTDFSRMPCPIFVHPILQSLDGHTIHIDITVSDNISSHHATNHVNMA